jgi:hypothetical protein
VQQRPAIAMHAGLGRFRRLPQAENGALLWVVTGYLTYALTYPAGKVVQTISLGGGIYGSGVCSDAGGRVFITAWGEQGGKVVGYIYEFAYGGKSPISTINEGVNESPTACSVDPTTGDLAVTNNPQPNCVVGGSVAIYPGGQGTPTMYTDPSFACYSSAAYDDEGNLFIGGMGYGSGSPYEIAELPEGSSQFTNIEFSKSITCHLSDNCKNTVQWNSGYLAVTKPTDDHGTPIVYRVRLSGSNGAVVGSTRFRGAFVGRQSGQCSWIQGDRIVLSYRTGSVAIWMYPAGGKILQLIKGLQGGHAFGLTISQ